MHTAAHTINATLTGLAPHLHIVVNNAMQSVPYIVPRVEGYAGTSPAAFGVDGLAGLGTSALLHADPMQHVQQQQQLPMYLQSSGFTVPPMGLQSSTPEYHQMVCCCGCGARGRLWQSHTIRATQVTGLQTQQQHAPQPVDAVNLFNNLFSSNPDSAAAPHQQQGPMP